MARGGFQGGMGGMNMNQLIKQAQKMQADMEAKKQQLAEQTVEAIVGGGVVKVTANGANQIVDISIAPDVVDPDDIEMLQDLIISAFNESIRKANDAMEQGMERAKGGLSIPGLF